VTEAVLVCPRCGHRNQPDARFCSSCGTALGRDARVDTQAIEAIEVAEEFADDREQFPEALGLLIVTRGPNVGARYALDAPQLSIGRHPESDIFLDDITVSRRHAELEHAGSNYVVRDASSLNGTYLNRVRIETPAALSDGDELQIGLFKLVFFHGTQH
jgi:pSer/pThr/pTyr-binding forkhead associated (FHA) protein